jgi:ATP-dependent exoDNAse (exonuclease V) beta subunit (contains helicase and exonuclease domains)
MQKRIQCGKDGYICYDDITVLVRAKKIFTEEIYNQLLLAGIPVSAEFSYSLYEYFEITQLIDYLKLIDNSMQDIPLLSVLKSCIGRFTDGELAQVRIKIQGRQVF